MAKPNLFRHHKLRHLTRLLRRLDVGPFPRLVAIGLLESLWQESYAVPSEYLGHGDDVEDVVHWDGEPGALVGALLEAGFLDRVEGGYAVHDWLDHLPDFARKRVSRAKKKTGKKRKESREEPASAVCPPDGGRTAAPVLSCSELTCTETAATAAGPAAAAAPVDEGEEEFRTAVERAFHELSGAPATSPRGERGRTPSLAPQDAAAVKSWYEAGVELETIWRCFREKASDSGLTDGSGRPIRTLRYFHDVVMEAHRLVLRLRGPLAGEPSSPRPPPEERAPTIESETWEVILSRLEADMEREEWETWFRPLAAQEESEGRLVVQTPNEHFVISLVQNERLRAALTSAAQGTSIQVTDGWLEPEEVRPCPVQEEPQAGKPGDEWPTEWDWDRLMLGAVSPEEAHRLLLILLVTYPQLADELSTEMVES